MNCQIDLFRFFRILDQEFRIGTFNVRYERVPDALVITWKPDPTRTGEHWIDCRSLAFNVDPEFVLRSIASEMRERYTADSQRAQVHWLSKDECDPLGDMERMYGRNPPHFLKPKSKKPPPPPEK